MNKELKKLFDDIEPCKSNQYKEEGSTNKQEPVSNIDEADTTIYLQTILEMQRNFKAIQEQEIQLQESIEKQALLLNAPKEIKTTLSIEDRKYLDGLPNKMLNATLKCKTEMANYFNNTIIPQIQLIIKAADAANKARIEQTKKEVDVKRGVYVSTKTFWAILILTLVSTSYAAYFAFKQCLWGELWERIWLPFFIIIIIVMFIVIILTNVSD